MAKRPLERAAKLGAVAKPALFGNLEYETPLVGVG
jgi:hypothetical protein